MDRVSDLEMVAAWRNHMERQPRSGLSIEKYCRREGIAPGTFYAWKRRLKVAKTSMGPQGKPKRNAVRRESTRSKGPGSFVHVPLPMSTTVQVRFADGTVVSLPPGDLDALATTLQTLRGAQLGGGRDD